MFNLFQTPSYQGSTLEGLINANPALSIQFNKETVDTFAAALLEEFPQPIDHWTPPANQTEPLEGKVKEAVNTAIPIGVGLQAVLLIMSAAGMAQLYGCEIDQLKKTNAGAAFALAAALAEYINACNVPIADTRGGYRRYMSGYLTLRDALESFGMLAPWEQRIAAGEAELRKINPELRAPKLNAEMTLELRKFVPKSEQTVLAQVAQQLNNVKNTVQWFGLMPGILDTAYLQMALSTPQLFMSGQWSGYSVALYTNGRCTFCGGAAPCRPCEGRLIEIAAMGRAGAFGGSFGGIGASQPGPASMRARQLLIDANVPF